MSMKFVARILLCLTVIGFAVEPAAGNVFCGIGNLETSTIASLAGLKFFRASISSSGLFTVFTEDTNHAFPKAPGFF